MTSGGQEQPPPRKVPLLSEEMVRRAHALGFDLAAVGEGLRQRLYILTRGRRTWHFYGAPEVAAFLEGFAAGRRSRRSEGEHGN